MNMLWHCIFPVFYHFFHSHILLVGTCAATHSRYTIHRIQLASLCISILEMNVTKASAHTLLSHCQCLVHHCSAIEHVCLAFTFHFTIYDFIRCRLFSFSQHLMKTIFKATIYQHLPRAYAWTSKKKANNFPYEWVVVLNIRSPPISHNGSSFV